MDEHQIKEKATNAVGKIEDAPGGLTTQTQGSKTNAKPVNGRRLLWVRPK